MTGNPKSPTGSLSRAIRERQKQVTAQEAAATRSTIEHLSAPPKPAGPAPLPSRPTSVVEADSPKPHRINPEKVATQTLEVVQQRTGWTRRKASIVLTLAGILGLIGAFGLLAAATPPSAPPPTPTFVPLPLVQSSDVVTYLKQTNMLLLDVQPLTIPDKFWQAAQGAQFTVQTVDGKGTFLLLSYDSTAQAGNDAFRASFEKPYSQWRFVQVSNVLLFATSDIAPAVYNAVVAQLDNELVVPFRPGLSTATPTLNPE